MDNQRNKISPKQKAEDSGKNGASSSHGLNIMKKMMRAIVPHVKSSGVLENMKKLSSLLASKTGKRRPKVFASIPKLKFTALLLCYCVKSK